MDRARAKWTIWIHLTVQYGVTVSPDSYGKYYVETKAMGCNGNALRRGLECPKPEVWTLG